MKLRINKVRFYPGVTVVEMVVAISIMAIVFAAIVPLFASIRKSWDTKQGNAELLQNGRVLIDHLNRNLSKAVKITDVSSSSETDGYVQFEDNDANEWRYEIDANNYVEFGIVGSLSDLAGPVSTMQFSCYDSNDFNNTTTDVNSIRFIIVETTLTNSAAMGQDRTFVASAYLRANGNNQCPWQNQDVGDVGAAGSASYADGTWTIEGSGYDIMWNTDEFHYLYQPLSGDGQIIARVVSIENTGSYAKAGVMIRETLDGNSRYAGMLVTPYNGVFFQCRTIIGGSTSYTAGSSSQAPRWFKLARSGNTFTGYESANGSTWTQVDSASVSMASDVYVGLAVCSDNDGILCTAEIGNISLSEITYEDFTEAKVSSDDTSITISTPGTSEGDLLIAAVATDEDTSASIAPPVGEGWTEIDIDNYSNEVTLGAWWKLADASESSSHQFTWSGSQQAYGWIMRFTGHDYDDPINAFSAYGESSSTPTSPAVTTTVNNCLILRLGAFDDDDITVDDPGLSGHTAITMDESSSSLGVPVGWWKLDETSGTTAADSSGNSNNGTLVNMNPTTDWVTGQIGGALDFSGYDDYVSLPIGSVINSLRNCTIATWVNWDGGDSWQRIWDFGTGTTYNMFLTPRNGSTNRLRFAITISGAAGEEQTTSPAILPTGWHHVAVTIDADNHTHKLYLDGSPIAQNTSGYLEPDDLGSTTKNWLGRSQYIADPYFDGRLDDVRIYDFTLSPDEVAELAQWSGGSSGTGSGGAGYVVQSASGGSGTSTFLLDLSNEAHALTIAIAPDPESEGGDCSIRP